MVDAHELSTTKDGKLSRAERFMVVSMIAEMLVAFLSSNKDVTNLAGGAALITWCVFAINQFFPDEPGQFVEF